jgi:hypothetical protein
LNTARVHSLIATCLAEPEQIDRLVGDGSDEASHRAGEHRGLDVEGIRLTAGFITKTRHNPLRRTVPWTLKALKVAGIELDVFASYAVPFAARRREGPLDDGERTRAFVDFLLNWLDPNDANHLLVRDIARHEMLTRALRDVAGTQNPPPLASSSKPGPNCVPSIRGSLHIHTTSCDPRKAIDALSAASHSLPELERRQFCFGYWNDGRSPTVEVFELDPAGTMLLAQIDGVRSFLDIARDLAESHGCNIDPKAVMNGYQEAMALGMIEAQRPQDNQPCD